MNTFLLTALTAEDIRFRKLNWARVFQRYFENVVGKTSILDISVFISGT